jgi:hypothetical protein
MLHCTSASIGRRTGAIVERIRLQEESSASAGNRLQPAGIDSRNLAPVHASGTLKEVESLKTRLPPGLRIDGVPDSLQNDSHRELLTLDHHALLRRRGHLTLSATEQAVCRYGERQP